jgi:hypothetical protein
MRNAGEASNADEVKRIARLLETLANLRKVRLSSVARHVGITGGNLRRILDGGIELKYRMILDILSYLDIPPLTFFEIAYEGQDKSAETMAGRLDRIRPAGQAPEAPKLLFVEKSELKAYVKEALAELGVLAPPHPPAEDDAEE